MAYIRIKQVRTPLRLLGIRLYKDLDTGKWYIKNSKYAELRRLRK